MLNGTLSDVCCNNVFKAIKRQNLDDNSKIPHNRIMWNFRLLLFSGLLILKVTFKNVACFL